MFLRRTRRAVVKTPSVIFNKAVQVISLTKQTLGATRQVADVSGRVAAKTGRGIAEGIIVTVATDCFLNGGPIPPAERITRRRGYVGVEFALAAVSAVTVFAMAGAPVASIIPRGNFAVGADTATSSFDTHDPRRQELQDRHPHENQRHFRQERKNGNGTDMHRPLRHDLAASVVRGGLKGGFQSVRSAHKLRVTVHNISGQTAPRLKTGQSVVRSYLIKPR